MRFGERRYLACMPEALVVAQYLGLAAQRCGQFACLSASIRNYSDVFLLINPT
jgi:hypothetical protein